MSNNMSQNKIIKTDVQKFRDPFVVLADGVYYAYGTCVVGETWEETVWGCYKNESGSLSGKWERVEGELYEVPENAVKHFWAPEVHRYNGFYYMFATYYSSKTNHRGCSILKSASPEGPFIEITNGHITPENWDAIDATFYVDKAGQPWIVFVHEWTCTDDGIGRMVVAKLSNDLTHLASEPVELFRADDPDWTNNRVTDGCFMFETEDGNLLMLWSNFDDNENYCACIARSDNGRPDGNYIQEKTPMFSKETTGNYDGGHGMIFKDINGEMYLSVHSPNLPQDGSGERMIFVPVKEENGTVICNV